MSNFILQETNRSASVAPSKMSSKSSLWLALANECCHEATENDQNLTKGSTRFGNGKARVQSRRNRETTSQTPTPQPRILNKLLSPRKQIPPTNTEPQLPKYPTAQNKISEPLVQYRSDTPLSPPPARSFAQPTTTLPLPEVPNLTQLVGGVNDHSASLFNSPKNQISRFAGANQFGENTDRVTPPKTDDATPKYDEKKLRASIHTLENKVAQLQHLLAESEHNVQYLRQKAIEAENKGIRARGRSDSALGSVSGGSEAGEEKPDVEHRKLMIEKNRILSESVELNRVVLACQEDLKTVKQQHADAVMQLEAAALSNEQLEKQNKDLAKQVYELKKYITEMKSYQEKSTTSFEADPNMSAIDAEWERIMYEREQTTNTRLRMQEALRAHPEQVSEPVPDIQPLISPISDDSRESQPASCTHQEPKITIDDVSMDLSYQSNHFEEPKFEEPAVRPNLPFSRSQITSPDSQADDSFVPPATTRQITDSLLLARRNIRKTQPTLPSLLDNDYEEQPSQPSLLHYNRKVQPILPSLLDDEPKNQHALPSLLDDEPKNQPALPCRLDIGRKNQPVLPSLLDSEDNKPVVASGPQQKTKRTKVIQRPVPVSSRDPVPGLFEEEPTIRPSQHPGIALASVLGALESELAELRNSAKKYQQIYDSHDAALSKRSRKNVFEKLQKLHQKIDVQADHIYSLYDVLEGQKQSGQEMSQEEIEVTLQSIGIDPDDITLGNSDFTGTHSTSSSRRV